MIRDMVVVDAVVHSYNLSPANQVPDGTAQLEALYASHRLATGKEHGSAEAKGVRRSTRRESRTGCGEGLGRGRSP